MTTATRLVGMELLPGDEAEAVVEAAEETQDDVVVERNAAVVIVSAPNRLEISPALVREHLGRDDWAGPDIQVIMSSYFGFITQLDDERIILEWHRKDGS
jgi:phenol/toluene 2-monooxygenase (NADH) P2/A2